MGSNAGLIVLDFERGLVAKPDVVPDHMLLDGYNRTLNIVMTALSSELKDKPKSSETLNDALKGNKVRREYIDSSFCVDVAYWQHVSGQLGEVFLLNIITHYMPSAEGIVHLRRFLC